MEIKDKRRTVGVSSLPAGGVVQSQAGAVCMAWRSKATDAAGCWWLTDLTTGETASVAANTPVRPLRAHLVIEGEL